MACRKVEDERKRAIASFGKEARNAKAELLAALDFIVDQGYHPSELEPRGAVRAIMIPVWPNAALAVFFSSNEDDSTLLQLYFKAVFGEGSTAGIATGNPIPPVPDAAWELASDRLDRGAWGA